MGEINFKYLGKLIVGSTIVVTFLLWVSKDRMMGKGIVFDDVYGKKIILMGDIDIQYKNNDL
jgi:hypothetical protein